VKLGCGMAEDKHGDERNITMEQDDRPAEAHRQTPD
jgi:hypothetical protein